MDLKAFFDIPPWEWPRDIGKRFLKALKDQRVDPSERLAAAKLGGDYTVINDDLAGALLAVLGNTKESEEMRVAAAISFGAALEGGATGFDDPDSVPISENMFQHVQESLEHHYRDTANPKLVRRKVLEASVRDPRDWHEAALREAYSSGDQEWMLTAVFGMSYVPGDFKDQILEALASSDPEIHFEGVRAAGDKEVEAAWPHVVKLINDRRTPKPLLLAAIEAAGSIRPAEARETLEELAESEDEEIADAAEEAISMAESMAAFEEDEKDEDEHKHKEKDGWVN